MKKGLVLFPIVLLLASCFGHPHPDPNYGKYDVDCYVVRSIYAHMNTGETMQEGSYTFSTAEEYQSHLDEIEAIKVNLTEPTERYDVSILNQVDFSHQTIVAVVKNSYSICSVTFSSAVRTGDKLLFGAEYCRTMVGPTKFQVDIFYAVIDSKDNVPTASLDCYYIKSIKDTADETTG